MIEQKVSLTEREKAVREYFDDVDDDLSEQDIEVLERAMKFSREIDEVPESERRPVKHPKKYSFPIGMLKDENGEYFLNTPENADRKRARNQD